MILHVGGRLMEAKRDRLNENRRNGMSFLRLRWQNQNWYRVQPKTDGACGDTTVEEYIIV
jgi:hypothetical protein